MNTTRLAYALAAAAGLLTVSDRAAADTFGSGANQFTIEFITIGDPGNAADTTGDPTSAGFVDYVYSIGKYEASRDMSDSVPTAVASGTAAGTAVWDQAVEQGPADITFAGGLSPYGVMGQAGNVWEWQETEYDSMNDSGPSRRALRGGDWSSSGVSINLSASLRSGGIPTLESIVGFRVASIPEPSSLLLGLLGMLGLVLWRRRAR